MRQPCSSHGRLPSAAVDVLFFLFLLIVIWFFNIRSGWSIWSTCFHRICIESGCIAVSECSVIVKAVGAKSTFNWCSIFCCCCYVLSTNIFRGCQGRKKNTWEQMVAEHNFRSRDGIIYGWKLIICLFVQTELMHLETNSTYFDRNIAIDSEC